MNGLVISSGGSKGAYAGGIVQHLISSGKQWDIFFGSSTGSLMIPFIAAGDIEGLKRCYTNINSEDIYTHDPFIVKQNRSGNFKYKINHWSIVRNFLTGNTTSLGSTEKLRELISNNFTLDHYNKIIDSGKDCRICVTNITTGKLEIKSILDNTYPDFCDWIWASTCAPPFMSIVEKQGYEYVDGGVIRPVPIRESIESGCDHIDVIVLNEKFKDPPIEKIRNALHLIQMTARAFLYRNIYDDIDIPKLMRDVSIDSPIDVDIYFTHRELTNNPLLFDSDLMTGWWQEGYSNMSMESWRITKRYAKLKE